jgi:hypothetical protein
MTDRLVDEARNRVCYVAATAWAAALEIEPDSELGFAVVGYQMFAPNPVAIDALTPADHQSALRNITAALLSNKGRTLSSLGQGLPAQFAVARAPAAGQVQAGELNGLDLTVAGSSASGGLTAAGRASRASACIYICI